MGLLVTFEGIEGCGKTTQVGLTKAFIEEQGYPCLVTQEPGGVPLGQEIRRLLLDKTDLRIDPLAELFLLEANRAQHVAEVIRPALKKGLLVLCDRYTDATVAYQGAGRGVEASLIEQMNQAATGGLAPQLTILLDCPVAVGMARARGEDRFEREDAAFHERVRKGYLQIARQEPQRLQVLSGEGTQMEIQQQIRGLILSLVQRR
ncbi:MAG: dTMP kinase [Deltaproteobacteria bacterium RBG_16_54_18]|jgi:dTMP kinase|nr:MAG: dTMP kinase [Deltaproteobacteria bacterium RBG_16_54_18]